MSRFPLASAPTWLLIAASLVGCAASPAPPGPAAAAGPQHGGRGSEPGPFGARPSSGTPDVETPEPEASASATTLAAEDPSRTSSTDAEAPTSPEDGPGVSASVAMTQQGTLEPIALVGEINRQRRSLQRCGPLVRRTDRMVGSLNLQITVDRAGRVEPELQSPVNPEARACLLAAARGWRLRGTGSGEAMVLLVLDDKSTP